MTRVEVDPNYFGRFLNCGPTVLAVAQFDGPPNIITLAWTSPVSHEPPLLMIAVSPLRYSHRLIDESGEVTVNIPPWTLLEETYFCGRASGRDVDKFVECALTPLASKLIKPPGIAECLATLECVVNQKATAGDHTTFILKILRVTADPKAVQDRFSHGPGEPTTIHHLGGNLFAPLGGPSVAAGGGI